MGGEAPLVSICLPVRNGAQTIVDVAESVLAQKYGDVELVISDNASTDDTEAVCRDLARADPRVRYHRNLVNVGLLNNFIGAARLARGEYLRWIGDTDRLEPEYAGRCLDAFAADSRILLVTTGLAYVDGDGRRFTSEEYTAVALGSDDPADRAVEMLRLLNESWLLLDPLYGMMRRAAVVAIARRNMLREDQIFAVKLALAGPWVHLPEVLAVRTVGGAATTRMQARLLAVPRWQAHVATALQVAELLRVVGDADLTPEQRRRVRAAVYRLYAVRQRWLLAHRTRKLLRMALLRGRG